MQAVIGKKLEQTQKFLSDGTRIPVTIVATPGNPVVSIKTMDKDGYWAMQLGFGERKHANKPLLGHIKKAQLQKAPFALREVRLTEKEAENLPEAGSTLEVATVLEEGDIVDVTGVSKGKGFAGGVKRHNFKGGPRTHGQSDRERAPGSLGQTTTPGRVYKGKRMAGKMGNDTVTLKNLEIVKIGSDFVWVRGLVPGKIGTVVTIKATGKKNKRFVEVMKTKEELAEIAAQEAKAAEEAEKARVLAEEEAKKAAAEAEAMAAKAAGSETPEESEGTKETEEAKVEVSEETKVAEESLEEAKEEVVEEVKTEAVATEAVAEEVKAEETEETEETKAEGSEETKETEGSKDKEETEETKEEAK
ncbi:MAG TPA: 50S ribosomal protein L3 [Patescibacteria group bacterium]